MAKDIEAKDQFNSKLAEIAAAANAAKLGGLTDWAAKPTDNDNGYLNGFIQSGVHSLHFTTWQLKDRMKISGSYAMIKGTPFSSSYSHRDLPWEMREGQGTNPEMTAALDRPAKQIVSEIERKLWDFYAKGLAAIQAKQQTELAEMAAREALRDQIIKLGPTQATDDKTMEKYHMTTKCPGGHGDIRIGWLTNERPTVMVELSSMPIELLVPLLAFLDSYQEPE
jgi:hypothetical protein